MTRNSPLTTTKKVADEATKEATVQADKKEIPNWWLWIIPGLVGLTLLLLALFFWKKRKEDKEDQKR